MNQVLNLNISDTLLISLLWVSLLFYAYFAYSFQTIAKKTDTPHGWLSWIPILNIFLLLSIGELSSGWMLLALVPFILSPLSMLFPTLITASLIFGFEITTFVILFIVGVVMWMKIAVARGKNSLAGLWILVPVANIILPGYLAFSGPDVPDRMVDKSITAVSALAGFTEKGQKHPELQKGEIFLANYTVGEFTNRVAWKTKRLGQIAYDREEKKILNPDIHPVFVQKAEMQAAGLSV